MVPFFVVFFQMRKNAHLVWTHNQRDPLNKRQCTNLLQSHSVQRQNQLRTLSILSVSHMIAAVAAQQMSSLRGIRDTEKTVIQLTNVNILIKDPNTRNSNHKKRIKIRNIKRIRSYLVIKIDLLSL